MQVSRYIHRNPVDLKKPLVAKLEDYPWSSYGSYINQSKPFVWQYRDTVYGELGSLHKYSAYKGFVEMGTDQETTDFYKKKSVPTIWGDKAFKELAYGRAQFMDEEVDQKGLKQVVPLPDITKAVAKHFEISIDQIVKGRRGSGSPNIPRWIAMKLCQEIGGAKLKEIAAAFHVGHYSTVSQTIGRLNRLIEKEGEFEGIINVLSQDLTP